MSVNGASEGTRTLDLRFTKPMLYQLSYAGLITILNYLQPWAQGPISVWDRFGTGIVRSVQFASTAHRLPSSVACEYRIVV